MTGPDVSELFDASAWRPVAGFDDLTDVTYHRAVDQGTVRIAFNRPEVRNAFRPHWWTSCMPAWNTHGSAPMSAASC